MRQVDLSLALALTLLGCSACGLDAPETDATITTIEVSSEIVGDTYVLEIAVPPGAEGPMPAVFVLDGDSLFEVAADYEAQLRHEHDTEPTIVVGVGYGYRNPYKAPCNEGRWRDLSLVPDTCHTGGAPQFVDALITELIPAVEAVAPVDPSRRVLAGHSLGGRTTLWAMLQHANDGTFAGYIAADGASPEVFDALVEAQETATDMPVALYNLYGGLVSLGGLAFFEEYNARLRAADYPGLVLETATPPREDHRDTQTTMFRAGLRWMLEEGL